MRCTETADAERLLRSLAQLPVLTLAASSHLRRSQHCEELAQVVEAKVMIEQVAQVKVVHGACEAKPAARSSLRMMLAKSAQSAVTVKAKQACRVCAMSKSKQSQSLSLSGQGCCMPHALSKRSKESLSKARCKRVFLTHVRYQDRALE